MFPMLGCLRVLGVNEKVLEPCSSALMEPWRVFVCIIVVAKSKVKNAFNINTASSESAERSQDP